MKILRLIHSLDPKQGGLVTHVCDSTLVLQSLGHTVMIVTMDHPDEDYVAESTLSITALGPSFFNYGYCPKLIGWLRRHVSDYDAVVVEGMWQYIGLAIGWLSLRMNICYYVCPHGMLDPWFKKEYPLKHIKKYIYWLMVEYWVLRRSCKVLFTTKEECRLARQSFWPFSWREAIVRIGVTVPKDIYLSLDEKKQAIYNRYPILRTKRCLLFLSRIHSKKGIELLIRSWAKLYKSRSSDKKDIILIIAGPSEDIDYVNFLKQLASQLLGSDHDSIIWMGMINKEDKWAMYLVADTFILPSFQENFGLVLSESLAMGTPVLTTKSVNIWKDIVDSGAGVVSEATQEGVDSLVNDWYRWSEEEYLVKKKSAYVCFKSLMDSTKTTLDLIECLSKNL